MGVITKTIYKCDCCGIESDNKDFNNGMECGSSEVKIKGSEGALCMGKDWGGSNINKDIFVCFKCSKKIIAYIQSLKQ